MWKYLAIVTCFVIGLAYWQWGHILPRYEAPKPVPEVLISAAEKFCPALIAFDDGRSLDDYLWMAKAALNLAKMMQTDTCEIYGSYWTLAAPSQKSRPRRFAPIMSTISEWSRAQQAAFAQAQIIVERLLRDPMDDIKKHPDLACVTRYIRTSWGGPLWGDWFSWTDRTAMRSEMRLVHTSKTGAEFFCPKNDASNFKPPGAPPGR